MGYGLIKGENMGKYPMVNKHVDPENHNFLMETNLPTPMTGRVNKLIYWRVYHNGMWDMVRIREIIPSHGPTKTRLVKYFLIYPE